MLAQSELSPLLSYEAKIQDRIAKFLTMKNRLVRMVNYPTIEIQTKARQLLAAQNSLENKLSEVLKTIEVLKTGAWTFSNIADIAMFYQGMEKQIKDTVTLEEKTGRYADEAPAKALDWTKWLMVGGIGISIISNLVRMKR